MESKIIAPKTFLNDFILLWLTSSMMHCTESWSNVFEGILSFFPIIIVLVYGFSTGVILLACGVSFFTVGVDVLGGANHANLYVFLNAVLCVLLVQQWIRKRAWDDFIERFAPLFRYGLALTYFMAGFHKLNTDFYNPEVSCISIFLNRFVDIVTFKTHFTFSEIEIFILATSLIALELFGGIFLVFKKTQWIGILCAMCLHIPLSLIVFYDFASIAFAILYLFFRYENTTDTFSFKMYRLSVSKPIFYYVLINSLVAVISYFIVEGRFYKTVYWFQNIRGLIFVISVILVERKVLHQIIVKRKWNGVSMRIYKYPLQCILLIVLFLFSITSYLGLRTAGNFTMFSNLHTEFEESNHFIMRNQPLKLFTQQNDLVEVICLDKKYRNFKKNGIGEKVPRLQFLKTIHLIKKRYPEDEVYVELNYKGQHEIYSNILEEPKWQVDSTWWLYFISFREAIDSPCPCRW